MHGCIQRQIRDCDDPYQLLRSQSAESRDRSNDHYHISIKVVKSLPVAL